MKPSDVYLVDLFRIICARREVSELFVDLNRGLQCAC